MAENKELQVQANTPIMSEDDRINIAIGQICYCKGDKNECIYEFLEKMPNVKFIHITKIMNNANRNCDLDKITDICKDKIEHLDIDQFLSFLNCAGMGSTCYLLCKLYSIQLASISGSLLYEFFNHLRFADHREMLAIFIQDKLIIKSFEEIECLNNFISSTDSQAILIAILFQHIEFDVNSISIIMNKLIKMPCNKEINKMQGNREKRSLHATFVNLYEKTHSLRLLLDNQDCVFDNIRIFACNALAKIQMTAFVSGIDRESSNVEKYFSSNEIYDRNVLGLIYKFV